MAVGRRLHSFLCWFSWNVVNCWTPFEWKPSNRQHCLTMTTKTWSVCLPHYIDMNYYSPYLIPWILGWSCSRCLCSSPDSPPWPWCQQRDSCTPGSGESTGTSSHCCGRATHPPSYMQHSSGQLPQNAHAGIRGGRLASLEKKRNSIKPTIIIGL